MDSNFTTCFEEKNYAYKYISPPEMSVTMNYLSIAKNSKIAQEKVKQFLLFLPCCPLSSPTRINSMEKV